MISVNMISCENHVCTKNDKNISHYISDMSNPVILSVKFTDNSAIRSPGNLLFATHPTETTTFTLFLDYPLALGKYVFRIGTSIIPTQSIHPIDYLGSTEITVVIHNSDLLNCSGVITLFKKSTHITIQSTMIYSKKPAITSCSHESININESAVVKLTGSGFDSKSYICLFTQDTYSYFPVYNIEPLNSCNDTQNISKIEFVLSKIQTIDLECGVFYIAIVSPSSPMLYNIIPDDLVTKTLPLGDQQIFSIIKIAVRPVIYSILNNEIGGGKIIGDKPVLHENASDYVITSGKAHIVTIIGSCFKRNNTSVAIYEDLSGNRPIYFIYGDSPDINYVDAHTLIVRLKPINIFRKLFFKVNVHNSATTGMPYPRSHDVIGIGGSTISSIINENKTLFVLPHILISNHNVLTSSEEPEFYIREPCIKIQVSNIFCEVPYGPNFQLYFKISPMTTNADINKSFTLSKYAIGYSICTGSNVINTNTAIRNTNYQQFITDASNYFQKYDHFAVDVFVQIRFDLQERELLLNSNMARILFRSNMDDEPHVESGHESSVDLIECNNPCEHVQKSHPKKCISSASPEIQSINPAYAETLSAIALDAGFDFAHNDEYLKTVSAYQVNSTTSRGHILAAFRAAFFHLTGYGEGIRMPNFPTISTPFSAQNIPYTTQQIGQIIQKMVDVIPCHTNPLLHHSIQGLCSHMLVSVLYSQTGKGYSPILKYALQDSLSVSNANVSLLFSEQISPIVDSYMLSPYVDINNLSQNQSLYGGITAESLSDINQLLTYGINGDTTSSIVNQIQQRLANTIDAWINNTHFLLVSDGGKYAGSSYMANIDTFASQYIQSIHSALVGNPNVNIISDIASITSAIQTGNGEHTLGKQFAAEIATNASSICRAILQADHTRQPANNQLNTPVLFRQEDRIIIYITITGSIENPDIDLRTLFSKNIDPLENNSNSFKQYLLNHEGTQIKPLKYAVVLPIG
jgi:hypothetical protein